MQKRKLFIVGLVFIDILMSGFSYDTTPIPEKANYSTEAIEELPFVFDINTFENYVKKFEAKELTVCAPGYAKTYMDYRATTDRSSKQYWFIHDNLTVDEKTGFLYDEDGFIAVALGSYYGEIGDRYYVTLENGTIIPVVKAEEKADQDTDGTGCYHLCDYSVIEFVIDRNYAMNYFGQISNEYVLNGNYNNHSLFNGAIVKIEQVIEKDWINSLF